MILGRNLVFVRESFCPIRKVLENHNLCKCHKDLGKTSLLPQNFFYLVRLCSHILENV